MPRKKQSDSQPEDKNQIIRDRILAARKNTKEWHNRVKQWNKYWNGTARPASVRPVDYIFVNYVFAIIKNKISRLYYRNPYIDVQARDANNEVLVDSANNAEAILNKQMDDRKLGIRGQIKKALTDWQRTGVGVFWVGWSTDLEQEGEEVTSINEDQPDFRRIHSLKVHLPPSFSPETIHKEYVVIEVDSSLDGLKKNKNYDQAVIKSLTAASITYIKAGAGDGRESKDLARVKTYHYYSPTERAVYVQGEEDPILAPEPNPYAEDYGPDGAIPLRFIWGDDDLETDWPISPIEVMKNLQMELNKTRTQKSTHRKRFNRKYLVDSQLNGDDLDKLQEGQDGTVVPVKVEGGKQISNLVWPVPDAQQNAANDEMDRLIKDDLNVVTGSTQVGLSGKSVNQTLGQDQIGETRSQAREDEEQEQVEEFVEEIYTCLLQINQRRLQTPIAVQISGSQNQAWKELSAEDIQGELSLKVISGSMVRETDDQVRKEAAAVSAHIATIPMLQELLPEITVSILDTYPQFSSVAQKAKEIVKKNEGAPPGPPPPPQSTAAQTLVAIADLLKAGVQVSIPQIEAALQMAGLPPSTPPPAPGPLPTSPQTNLPPQPPRTTITSI